MNRTRLFFFLNTDHHAEQNMVGFLTKKKNQLKNGIKNLNRCLCSEGLVKGIALNFLVDKTIF